jgi:hypothetical protein
MQVENAARKRHLYKTKVPPRNNEQKENTNKEIRKQLGEIHQTLGKRRGIMKTCTLQT